MQEPANATATEPRSSTASGRRNGRRVLAAAVLALAMVGCSEAGRATDAEGVARFATIWPGWYRGRTPHVHLKVFLDAETALTSQLFFPDGVSEALYRRAAPYAERGAPDTPNARDGIARRAGAAAVGQVEGDAMGMRVVLVLGIAADGLG